MFTKNSFGKILVVLFFNCVIGYAIDTPGIESSDERIRSQRQIDIDCPPPSLNYRGTCCIEPLFWYTDSLNSSKLECYSEIRTEIAFETFLIIGPNFGSLNPQRSCSRRLNKKGMECYVECVLKKLEITDIAGLIDPEKAFTVFAEQFNNKTWININKNVILDKCIHFGNIKTKEHGNGYYNKGTCSGGALEFMNCLHYEFGLKCPKYLKVDKNTCKRYRPASTEEIDIY